MIKEIRNDNIKKQTTIPQIPFIIDDIIGDSKILVVKSLTEGFKLIELNRVTDGWNMYNDKYDILEDILHDYEGCEFYDFNIELLPL